MVKLKLKVRPSKQESPEPRPKIKIKPPKVTKPSSSPERPRLKLSLSLKKQSSQEPKPKAVPKVRIKPTRVPGEGYDAEAPEVEDDPLIEQGIIIRFLNDHNLESVHSAVETGDLSAVNIKWITKDKAVINVSDTLYSARLVDLPTITEMFKTVDKKNIYKTFDISQVLLVLKTIDPHHLNIELDFEVPAETLYQHPLYKMTPQGEFKPSRQVYKHGLTDPYELVHRRFKPRKVNHRVMDDIDVKVNALVKADAKSEESHYELVDINSLHNKYGTVSGSPSVVSSPMPYDISKQEADVSEANMLENDVDMLETALQEELEALGGDMEEDVDLFGEEDEEEQDDDDDDDDDDQDDEQDDDDDDDEDDAIKEEKNRVKKLEEEIADLEGTLTSQVNQLAAAKNKMLQMKLQANCSTLRGQIEGKKRSLSKIKEEQQKLVEKLEPNHVEKDVNENDNDDNDNEDENEDENDDDIDNDNDNDEDDLDGLF